MTTRNRKRPRADSGTPIAFLDANILYDSALRDLLMHLHLAGTFRPKWTERVQEEWVRALLKNRPDLSAERLSRTKNLMNQAAPTALVEGYEERIEEIELPDRDDRHVVAAAIQCGASIIVTRNLLDFPAEAVEPHGVRCLHPDEFLVGLLVRGPEAFLDGVRAHRASLKNPQKTVNDYLRSLVDPGLRRLAEYLAAFEI